MGMKLLFGTGWCMLTRVIAVANRAVVPVSPADCSPDGDCHAAFKDAISQCSRLVDQRGQASWMACTVEVAPGSYMVRWSVPRQPPRRYPYMATPKPPAAVPHGPLVRHQCPPAIHALRLALLTQPPDPVLCSPPQSNGAYMYPLGRAGAAGIDLSGTHGVTFGGVAGKPAPLVSVDCKDTHAGPPCGSSPLPALDLLPSPGWS